MCVSSLFLLAQDNYHKYIASWLLGLLRCRSLLVRVGVKPENGFVEEGVGGGNSSGCSSTRVGDILR